MTRGTIRGVVLLKEFCLIRNFKVSQSQISSGYLELYGADICTYIHDTEMETDFNME